MISDLYILNNGDKHFLLLRVTNVRIDLTAINEIVRFNLFTGLRERTHGEILCKFKFDDLSKILNKSLLQILSIIS